MNEQTILTEAQALIHAESRVLQAVADQLDNTFIQAVEMLGKCSGRVFVTGAGTSGSMAKRLAHLLATTGTPAFFLSAGDALHGEAALFSEGDVLIGMSKSGKSTELVQLAQIAKQRGTQVMGWTAKPESPLAQLCDLVIVIDTDPAAEGEGILPFGSTLAHGAYGDALCLAVKRLRGFDLAEMKVTHPAGGVGDLLPGH